MFILFLKVRCGQKWDNRVSGSHRHKRTSHLLGILQRSHIMLMKKTGREAWENPLHHQVLKKEKKHTTVLLKRYKVLPRLSFLWFLWEKDKHPGSGQPKPVVFRMSGRKHWSWGRGQKNNHSGGCVLRPYH